MRLQSDLSAPLAAEGERPSTIGGTAAIAGAIPVLLFILSISFILLAGSASAGTETGEFCPTCPDWTNLDGWLEKKAAYEEDMKNVQQNEMNNNELKIKTAEAEIGLNAGQNSSFSTAYMGNSSNNNANNSISNSTSSALSRSSELVGAIASPNSISSDEVVLDISPSAAAYIEGAVNLNYDLFFSEGGEIVPVPEMARLLGDAGISSNDSLLIAGECLPCGGGPSPAFFTYWALKYLG
ncbi:MAG: sulfurtransferase, partial [Methanothrix soehngenii]